MLNIVTLFFAMPLCLLLTAPVMAQVQVPPKDFWEYMDEYSDNNGNVVDPLEYDQFTNLKSSESKVAVEPPATNSDTVKVRNADMKFEQKSSASSSVSAVHKGEAL